MERNAIAGIAADRNEARITLTGIADRPGMVAAVIGPLAEAGIQVDMIVHAATEGRRASDLTFTVPARRLAQAVAVIEKRRDEIGFDDIHTDDSVAKVSIVGVGIRSNPELAATMFATLAEREHQFARGQRRARSRSACWSTRMRWSSRCGCFTPPLASMRATRGEAA